MFVLFIRYEIVRGVRLPQRGKEWHSLRDGLLQFSTGTGDTGDTGDTEDTEDTGDTGSTTQEKASTLNILKPIEISIELETMLRKMMAPNPKDRPTARELLRHPLLQTESEQRLARAEALLKSHEARQQQQLQQQQLQQPQQSQQSQQLPQRERLPSQPRLKRAVTM